MAKKVTEQDAEQAAPAYRYRYSNNGADLAVKENGHTVVLKYGDMEPGVPVRPQSLTYRHRKGVILALLPGWGPPPMRVIAMVEFELPVTIKDPEVRDPKKPVRFWPADELEVIP